MTRESGGKVELGLEGNGLQRSRDNMRVCMLSRSSSVQISSVAQSCPTHCNPMNHSTPGLPVRHQLLEFTQTHVHRVSDAIQPSHPLLSLLISLTYFSPPPLATTKGIFISIVLLCLFICFVF